MKHPETIDMFVEDIGKIVSKKSGKPFKSGLKLGTVRGLVLHAQLNVPAYVFNEDDSYVRCSICEVNKSI